MSYRAARCEGPLRRPKQGVFPSGVSWRHSPVELGVALGVLEIEGPMLKFPARPFDSRPMEHTTESSDSEEDVELVHRLVYSSAATTAFSQENLIELLEKARSNNERMNVSGMLLHHEGTFIQVLEGDGEVIESLYSRIEDDDRHEEPRVLLRESEVPRSYSEWTMGFVRATDEMIEAVDGLNDFMRQSGSKGEAARSDAEESDDRVQKILEQFRGGLWRRNIE